MLPGDWRCLSQWKPRKSRSHSCVANCGVLFPPALSSGARFSVVGSICRLALFLPQPTTQLQRFASPVYPSIFPSSPNYSFHLTTLTHTARQRITNTYIALTTSTTAIPSDDLFFSSSASSVQAWAEGNPSPPFDGRRVPKISRKAESLFHVEVPIG